MSKKSEPQNKKSEPAQTKNATPTKASQTEHTDGVFFEAMQDVTPLAPAKKFVVPPVNRSTQKRVDLPRQKKLQSPPFEVHRDGERHYGYRTGLAHKVVAQLQRGEIQSEREIDLHGYTEESARAHALQFLRTAREDGLQCVSVVHGRGIHSPNEPVLKEALLNWLEADPAFSKLKKTILAFSTVARGGATLILFERKREGKL